ncbi:Major capsid protein Gp5 [uncultured Caudovirales phage]|uniref:Major capsid protein Gp5 n=1 Tax=uncultured Caudovirales phage TaxID=2100421 RepID=A0A6J5RJ63_9CAUD|nr:Major capsid protein Gp5 [uncultured Caudovirales phage]
MANTLTSLIPSLYKSLDTVSRELVGLIPCATLDATVARAAVGQTVLAFKTPTAVATDITPGVTPPNDGDQTIGNVSMTITKARRVPFRWNGEEELGLNNNGSGAANIKLAQMTQAMRTLVNEMEVDLWGAIRVQASRAYGTAGTTPFASDLSDTAQARKILDDNGAPKADRCMVIDTTAGAKVRALAQLTKANEAGTILTRSEGQLIDLHGFSLHESAAVGLVTKGIGNAYTTNTAGYAVGTTAITLITGTGTVNAGDVVTFAGDTNKYVVEIALTGGVVTLCAPGLRVAIAASATAMTVGNNFTANVAFSQSALILATRAPALPDGGDLAVDRMIITDPRSGISFEVAMYPQYRQMQYEVSAAWGVKGIKANHSAILLG